MDGRNSLKAFKNGGGRREFLTYAWDWLVE